MSNVIALGKQCPDCNSDKWVVSNEPKYYIEICNVCGYMNEIKKQDFIDDFICSECNCLEGALEENKKYMYDKRESLGSLIESAPSFDELTEY